MSIATAPTIVGAAATRKSKAWRNHMTAVPEPTFITDFPDAHARRILRACWVATQNCPEHHLGISLAMTQVRVWVDATDTGRNVDDQEYVECGVKLLVALLARWQKQPRAKTARLAQGRALAIAMVGKPVRSI